MCEGMLTLKELDSDESPDRLQVWENILSQSNCWRTACWCSSMEPFTCYGCDWQQQRLNGGTGEQWVGPELRLWFQNLRVFLRKLTDIQRYVNMTGSVHWLDESGLHTLNTLGSCKHKQRRLQKCLQTFREAPCFSSSWNNKLECSFGRYFLFPNICSVYEQEPV